MGKGVRIQILGRQGTYIYHSCKVFAVIANLYIYQVVDATKEQFLPEHLKEPPKENCTLVRFFGTYD